MKQTLLILIVCLLLAGCGSTAQPPEATAETAPVLQMGNPWEDYASLEEAEAACGLDFPMPEIIADSYSAESFRVMNGQLLEVTYRDETFEVTVRMQAGEGQDLSGVYGEFEDEQTFHVDGAVITVKSIDSGVVQLVFNDGYSYSLYAPNHYWGDSNTDFLKYLYDVS